jgi:hypothetical protein
MSSTPTYLQLGYIDKKIEQSMRWANGVPTHDTTYDECCADFSCCHPELFEHDAGKRFTHHAKFMGKLLERRKTVLAVPPQ